MHPTTAAVRALYERFPYPAGPITLRLGFDVRRALSFLDADRPPGRRLQVLDAGCGRGSGLLGMAIAQPDIEFVGVDVNRVALAEVDEQARARGLHNVRTAEVDLEALEGLPMPDGGYDLIVSSGVIHHLVDPRLALERLSRFLAPWGALDLMVYARPGRVGIEQVAHVIAEQVPDGPLEQRLAAARALVARRPEAPFVEARQVNDVEFVDRYLHPQFVSYSLDELRTLVEGAGLALRRWTDPKELPVMPTGTDPWLWAASHAPAARPKMWSALLSRPAVGPRPTLTGEAVAHAAWALNPEGTLARPVRTMWTGPRAGAVMWMPPVGPPVPLPGPLGDFLLEVGAPFSGRQLLAHLGRHGVSEAQGRAWLTELERGDVLWRPHASDLRGRRAADHGVGDSSGVERSTASISGSA